MTLHEEAERLHLAMLRLYVVAIYRPLKPVMRWLDRLLEPKGNTRGR